MSRRKNQIFHFSTQNMKIMFAIPIMFIEKSMQIFEIFMNWKFRSPKCRQFNKILERLQILRLR